MRYLPGLLTLFGALISSPDAQAAEARVSVNLFGQPCMLHGPLDPKTLSALHSLSPEQLVPPFGASRTIDQTKRALDKLEKATGLPPGLERYRDKQSQQLKAQLAFLGGIEVARKANQAAPLIAAARPLIRPSRVKELEALAAKIPKGAPGAPSAAQLTDQLCEFFNNATDSNDAEEEFHRAIRRLKVQYDCNYDEGGAADGEEDEAPPPAKKSAPAPVKSPS